MKDEYVFPQTPADDKNFNRTGGLTKLEHVALRLMPLTWSRLPMDFAIIEAFDVAEKFLAQSRLRREPPYKGEGV